MKTFRYLGLVLCFLISMGSYAVEVTIGDLKYTLNGTEAYVSGYTGNPTDVIIPATIESEGQTFKVTKISSKAFFCCTSLTSVRSVGENLKYIGNNYDAQGCFEYCTSLESVYFPSVTNIGAYAFENCTSLPYIVLPSGCTIGGNVFQGCSRLQAIIYLGNQTNKGGSNATVYNVNNMVTWSENSFAYSGSAPTPTFTNNLPMGFQAYTNAAQGNLEKNVGEYNTTVPITFANTEQTFTVNIPFKYTITPITLTAQVKNATKVYGEANPKFESVYSGFITGEDASVITTQGTYSTSATTKSDVGNYGVTQSGAVAKNYVFNYKSGTLAVTKAPLTMTPRDKTMTYGDALPTFDVDYAGLKNSESAPVWISQPTITTSATSLSNAGTYPITISGGVAKNYDVTFKKGTLTINKVLLIATTKDATRVYGDDNPDFEMTYSGLKNGETAPVWTVAPTFATPASKTSPVGVYGITVTGGEAQNYMVQFVNNGKLTVTKAPLTARVRSMSRLQGESNPTFVIDYEGFKNGETALALTEEPIATTTATLYSRPGTYPITISGGIAMNYDFIYVNGTLTVLPKEEPGDPTDNMLTLSSISGNKRTQVVLPVGLKNDKQITGLQLDLYLPDGVTVATNSKGKMLISTTDRMEGTYSISSSQMDGFVRILGYSADGDAFSGNSGDILNVTLNIADNVADGNYTIRVKDIVLSDVNSTEYHPADAGATLTVKSYVLGDVDNSGAININDVVCIINHILNRQVGTFIAEAADVDGSGTININDVVTLINRYILHKSSAPVLLAPALAGITDDNYLHLATISLKPGETKEIEMILTNGNAVAAVQGNVKLPEGVSFVTKSNGRLDVKNIDSRSEDFTLSCALQEDGSMTFAHYSADGFTYDGSDGGIFTFKVKADENAVAGNYNVNLSDVVLSINGVGYELTNRTSTLTVGNGTTGIRSIDNSPLTTDSWYTIDGKKLAGEPKEKGIYIYKGKKVKR